MPIIHLITVLMLLLLLAAAVQAFCKSVKLPFAIVLVLVGMVFSYLGHFTPTLHAERFQISSNFIIYALLPTLLFEAAYGMNLHQMRQNLKAILVLAIPGLLLSTVLIGLILVGLTPLTLALCLLIGAILSATDPVVVLALFKQLAAPKSLTVLMEGESLFNDATAIVTAKIILMVLLAGAFGAHHIAYGMWHFCLEFFGGVLIGWIIAVMIGFILGLVESDPYIEISLTTILAYGTFLIANEWLHVSGVMATVAAGLTLSSWGRAKISPSILGYLEQFWSFLAYIANSLIFLLVGFSVNLQGIFQNWLWVVITIMAMWISRAAVIYGLLPLLRKTPSGANIDKRYQAIMYWGGMRGAIAFAIVLSLPAFPQKEQIISVVVGAVLFTLFIQGLTIARLVSWLGLDVPKLSERFSKLEGQLSAMQHALAQIPTLRRGGLFSARIANRLESESRAAIKTTTQSLEKLRKQELNLDEEIKISLMHCLAVEKSYYYELFIKGHISEHSYRYLANKIVTQSDHLSQMHAKSFLQQSWPLAESYRPGLLKIFNQMTGLALLANWLRSRTVVRVYEELWAQHQSYLEVLKFAIELDIQKKNVIAKIKNHYKKYLHKTKTQIDEINEHFPEFVAIMQERLAKRLLLQAEYQAVKEQEQLGMLSFDVAKRIESNLENQIAKLREKHPEKISKDPKAWLRKVPFLKAIPSEQLDDIAKLLKERVLLAEEAIVKEGEPGKSMFFILRGVIRVSKVIDGVDQDIATLTAGDFFGEIALLKKVPRTASCRSITPTSLYELHSDDFNKLKEKYPSIKEVIEKTATERF